MKSNHQNIFPLCSIVTLLSLFLSFEIQAKAALENDKNREQSQSQIERKLTELFGPETPFSVEKFDQQLYLVQSQGQTFFSSADGRYLMLGKVIDTIQKVDISEIAQQKLRKSLIQQIPRSALLSYQAKNQQHVITVFTDIDCPFCRRLHRQINTLNANGITVDYVMVPRGKSGSKAYTKTAQVLCASNPQSAMNQAMHTGSFSDSENRLCDGNLPIQQKLAQQFGFAHTPTILLSNGEAIPGYIKADQLIERLSQL